MQRYRFNTRVRRPHETIAIYILQLTEYCNYGDTLPQMLHDCLVCGIAEERCRNAFCLKMPSPTTKPPRYCTRSCRARARSRISIVSETSRTSQSTMSAEGSLAKWDNNLQDTHLLHPHQTAIDVEEDRHPSAHTTKTWNANSVTTRAT